MIEDYEFYVTPPQARPNWVQRLLAPFRLGRPAAVPNSAHLRRDLGLGEEPIGHRDGPHRIVLPQVARTIEALPDETILAAALREGLAYPHGCQRGRCGSCKSRLLHGEVEMLAHSPFALAASEHHQGLVLACRAVPTSDVTVYWPDAAGALPPVLPVAAIVVARHEMAPQIHRLG